MKINKTSLGLALLGGAVAITNPILAIGCVAAAIGNHYWDEYEERETERISNALMTNMIKEDHAGLRSIVGDEQMDRARDLLKE